MPTYCRNAPSGASIDTCMALSRARAEPLAGTAPVALGWLLIEQPGPWGRKELFSSGLDPQVGGALAAASKRLPVRVQLIRRPGRSLVTAPGAPIAAVATGTEANERRRVVLVHAGPTPWVEVITDMAPSELRAFDLERLLDPHPPGLGYRSEDPWLLVCAHGKRDVCCASAGRPVAAALAERFPDSVWEASHIGGHRFAANLTVLPSGLTYGGLDPQTADQVVDAHLRGEVEPGWLRGRGWLDRPAQAAEIFLRQRLRIRELDAVGVRGSEAVGQDTAVLLEAQGERFVATVRRIELDSLARLSCDADEPEDPGRFELVELRSTAAG